MPNERLAAEQFGVGGPVPDRSGSVRVDDQDVAAGVPPEFTAGAAVHQRRQPAVGRRADHDGAGPDGVGVLGDHPPGGAVIRGVQQDLPLGGDVVGRQAVQVVPDHRPGRFQILTVGAPVTRGSEATALASTGTSAAAGLAPSTPSTPSARPAVPIPLTCSACTRSASVSRRWAVERTTMPRTTAPAPMKNGTWMLKAMTRRPAA